MGNKKEKEFIENSLNKINKEKDVLDKAIINLIMLYFDKENCELNDTLLKQVLDSSWEIHSEVIRLIDVIYNKE